MKNSLCISEYDSIKIGQTLWAIRKNGILSPVIVISKNSNQFVIEYDSNQYDIPCKFLGSRLFLDKDTAEKFCETGIEKCPKNIPKNSNEIPSFEPKINLGGCGFGNGNSFGKSTPGKIKNDELRPYYKK